jgi:hypothetical protein
MQPVHVIVPRRVPFAKRHEIAHLLEGDPRPWHCLVSSRLGRSTIARRSEIATAYRWTQAAVASGYVPIAIPETATFPWVVRACELIGTRPLIVSFDDHPIKPITTDASLTNANKTEDGPKQTGPREAPPPSAILIPKADPAWSRDQLPFLLADRIDVISVRPGGTILPLLEARLREDLLALSPDDAGEDLSRRADAGCQPSIRILVKVPGWGQTVSAAEQRMFVDLISLGAIGHCWREPSGRADTQGGGPPGSVSSETLRQRAAMSLLRKPNRWLIHSTRARSGPWPGESESQFRDWLLLSNPTPSDPSPLETLHRIVRQRHLIGGGPTIRGGRSVVSFSALPLLDFVAHRTFRPHVGRWDAEPYGIAIRKDVARKLGARSVIYVDRDFEPEIPPASRWRIQPRGKTFDWTAEREWRVRGDIDLRHLASDEAIVFVDRDAEVSRLADSPWPVISIESLRQLAPLATATATATSPPQQNKPQQNPPAQNLATPAEAAPPALPSRP